MREDGRTLHISWVQSGGEWALSDVIFPDKAFASTGEEGGVALIPNRFGLLMYAEPDRLPSRMSFLTYDGYGGLSMAMAGMARRDSGVLLWWNDVETSLTAERSWNPAELPGRTAVDLSLSHQGPRGEVFFVNPGSGDYTRIANAYRDAAREKGFLVTLREKAGGRPHPLDGAMSFRPMVFFNFAPETRWNPGDKPVQRIGFTFAEIAEAAEYIRHELGVAKVMVTIMGWMVDGYDSRIPDVLPACLAAGADAGLRDATDRIAALGYLVGLHDNYGDFYRSAPSFSEEYVQRKQDGSLHLGGVWWGGQAYIINPKWSLHFARRNLPEYRELFPALNYHYIDTTFAVPLSADYNPDAPMSREEDMRGKQELCRFARSVFGLMGSEDGVEWGVEVADHAESMLSHRVTRASGEVIVPLFEMVYGDSMVVYQGNRTLPTTPTYVMDHLIAAEMPQIIFNKAMHCDVSCRVSEVAVLSDGVIAVELEWLAEKGSPRKDYKVFVHLDRAGQNVGYREGAMTGVDFLPEPSARRWPEGEPVKLPPFNLELDTTVDGRYDLIVGLLDGADRVPLRRLPDLGHTRYLAAVLEVKDGAVAVLPPDPPAESCFARLDSRPELSYTNEGFMVNLNRIFSPLIERAGDHYMTAHRFLTPDRTVEQSEFGPVRITVNFGEEPHDTGRFLLPKWGFAVEAPDFTAFRADAVGGRKLGETTLLAVEAGEAFLAYGDLEAIHFLNGGER